MRLHSKLTWFATIAVLGYAATPLALAQTQTGGTTTTPTVAFGQQVPMTVDQQITALNGYQTDGNSKREAVQNMLRDARQQRDVVKVLCLNDKLNQIDVALRSLKSRTDSFTLNTSDTELRNHEFTIATVLYNNIKQKMAEANQCIGQEAAFTGTTTTYATIDPDIANYLGQNRPVNSGDIPAPPTNVGPPSATPPPPPCSPFK